MTTMLRAFLTVLLAAWLAMPTIGGEGGENAGGTGVWILPAACFLTGQLPSPTSECRASFVAASIQQDARLQLSAEMGGAVATFVDPVSGTPVALQVSGLLVCCPASLLEGLAASGGSAASILITDASQRGYVVYVTVDPTAGSATFKVY